MDKEAVPETRERVDTANLRLEMHALSQRINAASLPEALKSVKRAITWSALGIAVALVISGALHMWGSSRLERLEQRVEVLERYHAAKAPL